jgi:hypothetical protein
MGGVVLAAAASILGARLVRFHQVRFLGLPCRMLDHRGHISADGRALMRIMLQDGLIRRQKVANLTTRS